MITSVQRRRRWSRDEKLRIVAELAQPGRTTSQVARDHGIAPGQLFTWRRQLLAEAIANGATSERIQDRAFVWTGSEQRPARKGFDGLAMLVQEKLRRDPFGGQIFVFRGRRGYLLEALWRDSQGLCLFAKRLEKGRFVWPSPADGSVVLTPAELGMLLEGIDWRMPVRTWRPEAAG